jgi:glucosyl-3-phosphoglycerate synthase
VLVDAVRPRRRAAILGDVTSLRSHPHADFPAARVARERRETVSVCLPARNEAATIRPILERLLPLRERGVVDEIIVLDDSTDCTGAIAAELGAEVHDQSSLCPEYGPVRGKGDALWRGLSIVRGDIVCFLDADSERFGEHFACGLIGAVACLPGVAFAKAQYRRPFRAGGVEKPAGGGRVTELTARPALELFYPELASFRQPLAGEIAVRRSLLESVPFVTGYGVDVALLIDTWGAVGIDAMVQVDLDVRQNRHQSLEELAPMARAVLAAVMSRVAREGRAEPVAGGLVEERPPMGARLAAA